MLISSLDFNALPLIPPIFVFMWVDLEPFTTGTSIEPPNEIYPLTPSLTFPNWRVSPDFTFIVSNIGATSPFIFGFISLPVIAIVSSSLNLNVGPK